MTFKCGEHDFQTEKIEDWLNHKEEKEHTIQGISPCKLCGFKTEFSFKGKVKDSIPSICSECKKGLK